MLNELKHNIFAAMWHSLVLKKWIDLSLFVWYVKFLSAAETYKITQIRATKLF